MTKKPDLQEFFLDPDLLRQPTNRKTRTSSGNGGSKAWGVYQALKRRIIVGLLTCDSAITEQSLAQEFGCSQGTVREALLTLQEDGLVERQGYKGTFVTPCRKPEIALLLRLRYTLEVEGLTEEAVQRCTDLDLLRLRRLSDIYVAAKANRDFYACSEIDRSLHLALLSLGDLAGLAPLLNRALLITQRYVLSQVQHYPRWASLPEDPHVELLDALESRDAAKTRALLGEHVEQILRLTMPEEFDKPGPFHVTIGLS